MGKRKYDYVVERVNEQGLVYSREYYTSLKEARTISRKEIAFIKDFWVPHIMMVSVGI